ncbi:NmrA family NAD(P)-binding protein [Halobaculum litoreum]|uniref:NmrA family NAD(P)-binding protein n=1 Tax=Halobaculum litoreum TaxID=3031998 RepID=A0ABD5XSG9_9EURY
MTGTAASTADAPEGTESPSGGATDVLVTAATGTVGRHVVAALRDRGVAVRAGTRRPDAADVPAGAAATAFDYGRPETWGPALDGADGLFLVLPPGGAGVDRLAEFASAAVRTGVDRIVFLSTLGADKLPFLPHRRIERRLAALPATTTFLRASFFMQNLTEVHAAEIREEGAIVVPAGDGRTSFVDAADVGAVGAAVLADPEPRPGPLDLTGPAALTYHEVADALSTVLDREIAYEAPSVVAFLRHSVPRRGLAYSAVMVGIYTSARLGLAGRVTDTVRTVTGREPTALRSFVRRERAAFTE